MVSVVVVSLWGGALEKNWACIMVERGLGGVVNVCLLWGGWVGGGWVDVCRWSLEKKEEVEGLLFVVPMEEEGVVVQKVLANVAVARGSGGAWRTARGKALAKVRDRRNIVFGLSCR